MFQPMPTKYKSLVILAEYERFIITFTLSKKDLPNDLQPDFDNL